MRRRRPTERRYLCPLVWIALSTAACSVDDRALQPAAVDASDGGNGLSFVIATFEDGTGTPDDSRFGPFRYYAAGPSTPDLPPGAFVNSPIVQPGYASNFALGLNWEVIDPQNGVDEFPSVGVTTGVRAGVLDLSAYDRVVFEQQYQHQGSCAPVANITVSLGCTELNTSFQALVPVANSWKASTARFDTFSEMINPPTGISVRDCLEVFDGITFWAGVDVGDGGCASGSLLLDSISIRATPP